MAKDPAFLFYPNDWIGGTMILSRHLKGCYIDLLMAQFNSGPLSLEEIKTVLGSDFSSWEILAKKFKKNKEERFFNERLEGEKNKRIEYSIKQKERIKKRWNDTTVDTTVLPGNYLLENENTNEDINVIKDKGVQGEKDLSITEVDQTIEYVDRVKQVKLSPKEVINFWEAFLINQAEPAYSSKSKKVKHFRDWLKNQQNGHKTNATSNGTHKPGTSEARIAAARNWVKPI